MTRIVDWQPLAASLAETVRRRGYLTDPMLYRAFAHTPRHLFVPTFRDYAAGRWITEQEPEWLETVYSDEPLVTQVKPEAAEAGGAWPTCSSSMPSLMADMLEELDFPAGVDVLEVGTGTGYNAAVLCRLLGDAHVTTIDIDVDLVRAARNALARLNYHPGLIAAEHAYDRVLVTHAVTDVPAEWLRWCRPGGVILADLRSVEHNETGAWVKLTVGGDGTATGVVMPARGTFMGARRVADYAEPGYRPPELGPGELADRAEHMQRRATDVPPEVLDDPAFGLLVWRALPGVNWWNNDGQYGLNAPRDCWANVTGDGTVVHGGPVDLWATVEQAHARWVAAGSPGLAALTVTVTAGQTRIRLPD